MPPGCRSISRVRLKNYKSIAECDVRLGPLTILVGPNGSGKSNFLDALALLSRAVATTPAEAIDERGGLREILRRVPDQTDTFSISVEEPVWGRLPDQRVDASYSFEIGPPERRGLRSFEVVTESCELRWGGQVWRFLAVASVQQAFAPLFVGLSEMRFYNFEPEVMRRPQAPTTGAVLGRAGEIPGDVLGALSSENLSYKRRIDEYLRAVVPGVSSIERYHAGKYVTVALRARAGSGREEVDSALIRCPMGPSAPLGYSPPSSSPGSWEACSASRNRGTGKRPAPSGGRCPLRCPHQASEHVQVLATSQSADLLDRDDLDSSIIHPVAMHDGLTLIGDVDAASREIAGKKLFTLGELMRGNQLAPQPAPPADLAQDEA